MAYYGTSVGQKLSTPLGTTTTRDRFGLVTVEIGGEPYVITDIGMRMLTSRELYRGNGYPEDHIIEFEYNGKPFPKEEQVAKCGNGVPPIWAKVLVGPNLPDLCVRAEAA